MITDRKMRLLIMELASHRRMSNKWFKVEAKPARKGTVNGIGSKGRERLPKYSSRATVTFTDLFRKTLSEMIDQADI